MHKTWSKRIKSCTHYHADMFYTLTRTKWPHNFWAPIFFRKQIYLTSIPACYRAWVPFQHISPETAPTVLVPKSHKWTNGCQTGHFENRSLPQCPNYGQLMAEQTYWHTKVVSGLEPGDALLINTRVLHGWGPNKTQNTRLAMRLTIKESSATFYEPIGFSKTAKRDLTQPQIWPKVEHSHEEWPIKEMGFSSWAQLTSLVHVGDSSGYICSVKDQLLAGIEPAPKVGTLTVELRQLTVGVEIFRDLGVWKMAVF